MNRLDGRRAVVTGGAAGIGAAIASRLVAEDAEVLIADVDEAAARATAARLGDRASAVGLDVADADRVQRTLAAAGPFDVLVNNAGTDDFGWFTEMTPQRWRRLLAINLEGVFACTRAVLPGMQAAGYGRIVVIGSEAGRIGSSGNAVYAATKGALIAFVKSLARENGRYGVTANVIAPGPIETPLLDANRRLPRGDRIVAAMIAGTQLRRLGRAEEVAAAAAFLAAPEASYVTGEVLGVSGGMGLGA
jgi:2-hydroxycyclohexanecarboxyl-CoA dehydrogenase